MLLKNDRRVLLVEDNPDVRYFERAILAAARGSERCLDEDDHRTRIEYSHSPSRDTRLARPPTHGTGSRTS